MEFKGTRGKWEVVGFPSVQVKGTDWCIADVEQSANDDENYANAKLIAAAPELLEALQDYLRSDLNELKELVRLEDKAKKAIEKALK